MWVLVTDVACGYGYTTEWRNPHYPISAPVLCVKDCNHVSFLCAQARQREHEDLCLSHLYPVHTVGSHPVCAHTLVLTCLLYSWALASL